MHGTVNIKLNVSGLKPNDGTFREFRTELPTPIFPQRIFVIYVS